MPRVLSEIEVNATLEQEYLRLKAECSVCESCGHVQAEPNWCHRCERRVAMPEWAAALTDELATAKDERDVIEGDNNALRAALSEIRKRHQRSDWPYTDSCRLCRVDWPCSVERLAAAALDAKADS